MQIDTKQLMRDLEWVAGAPALLKSPVSYDTAQPAEVLDLCPRDLCPSDLAANLDNLLTQLEQQPSRRVGLYFEALVGHLLEQSGKRVVAHRHQIRISRRTVGELDFIYEDELNRQNHLEVAVKFFLYLPEAGDSESAYIGPNPADNLESKLRRLLEHQLPLSSLSFPAVVYRQLFVKGRIFYNPCLSKPRVLPAALAPDHQRGIWLRASQLDWLRSYSEAARYKVLDKPYWLSGELGWSPQELLTFDELTRSVVDSLNCGHASLFSIMRRSSGAFYECQRCFVVSDKWPSS